MFLAAPKKATKQDDAKATSKKTDLRELTEEEKKEAQIRADMSNAQELFGNFYFNR